MSDASEHTEKVVGLSAAPSRQWRNQTDRQKCGAFFELLLNAEPGTPPRTDALDSFLGIEFPNESLDRRAS